MKPVSLLFLLLSVVAGAETRLGKPLSLDSQTPIEKLLANPDRYAGKTVQVKGKVTEVCQAMGCWMHIVDPATNAMIRIKVNDGEIVFPKDSPGKMAVAEGKLVKLELSKEQAIARARHEAEENGRSFDPNSIKGPKTIYQIRGTGAVILE